MEVVESRSIAAVGYDAGSETLTIRFKRGGTYEYYSVDQSRYDALMSADSKGEFIAKIVKPNHTFSKI